MMPRIDNELLDMLIATIRPGQMLSTVDMLALDLHNEREELAKSDEITNAYERQLTTSEEYVAKYERRIEKLEAREAKWRVSLRDITDELLLYDERGYCLYCERKQHISRCPVGQLEVVLEEDDDASE